jgi:transglutaminase-like putative cysteine protease
VRYLIEHETQLQFPGPVTEHQCELRLSPYLNEYQEVEHMTLETEPEGTARGYVDCFGNQVHHFGVLQPHERLLLRCRSRVQTKLSNPFGFDLLPPAREKAWLDDALRAKPRLWGYVLHRSPTTPELNATELDALEAPRHDPGQPIQTSVMAAMEWIRSAFEFEPEEIRAPRALAEVIGERSGTRHDFAHLLVTLVRSWSIPARFATGYVDPETLDHDAPAAAHAWAEVLLPGTGWHGFDPSRGLLANDSYVLVAVGRNYDDAAPLRGSFKGVPADEEPQVRITITRDDANDRRDD